MENSPHEILLVSDSSSDLFPGISNFNAHSIKAPESPYHEAMSTEDPEYLDDPSYMLYFSDIKLNGDFSKLDKINDCKGISNTNNSKQIRRKRILKSKSSRWTADEDKLLIELYFQYALDWKTIAKFIPGRAADAVKNRFYGVIKKNASWSDQKNLNMVVQKARENRANSDCSALPNISEEADKEKLEVLEKNSTILDKSLSELKNGLQKNGNKLSSEAKVGYLDTLKKSAEKLEEQIKQVRDMLRNFPGEKQN